MANSAKTHGYPGRLQRAAASAVDVQLVEHVCAEPIFAFEVVPPLSSRITSRGRRDFINRRKLVKLSLRLPVKFSLFPVRYLPVQRRYAQKHGNIFSHGVTLLRQQAPPRRRSRLLLCDAEDTATPIMRLATDAMASSEPSTAARNQPAASLRMLFLWSLPTTASEATFIRSPPTSNRGFPANPGRARRCRACAR